MPVKGQYTEALRHFRGALELRPQSAEIHNNLGVTWHALGDRDRARSEIEAALKIDPEYRPAKVNLAKIAHRSSLPRRGSK